MHGSISYVLITARLNISMVDTKSFTPQNHTQAITKLVYTPQPPISTPCVSEVRDTTVVY